MDTFQGVVPFEDMITTAPLAVLVHVDGTVVYANRCAEDFLGVGPGQAAGLRLVDVVHPDSLDHVRHRAEHLLSGRALAGSGEWTIVRPDGVQVRVESVESPLPVGDRLGVHVMACDVTERTRREAHLAHLATHDGLTALPNRLLLLDRLGQALTRIGRGCTGVLVLFVDLDRFKSVNDAHGHAAGDEVLREAARRLVGAVRAGDTVARLSGDEFVICAEIDEPGADDTLRRRVCDVLSQSYRIGTAQVDVGASVGALLLDGPTDPGTALAEADRLMYEAKRARAGRPGVPEPARSARAGGG
jgi:diguanylate cyclase (GGDEF)-like protein/PAS domain S-box-containing protein